MGCGVRVAGYYVIKGPFRKKKKHGDEPMTQAGALKPHPGHPASVVITHRTLALSALTHSRSIDRSVRAIGSGGNCRLAWIYPRAGDWFLGPHSVFLYFDSSGPCFSWNWGSLDCESCSGVSVMLNCCAISIWIPVIGFKNLGFLFCGSASIKLNLSSGRFCLTLWNSHLPLPCFKITILRSAR